MRALELLKHIQNKYPQLRLGQILAQAIDTSHDLFYKSDRELEEELKKFLTLLEQK